MHSDFNYRKKKVCKKIYKKIATAVQSTSAAESGIVVCTYNDSRNKEDFNLSHLWENKIQKRATFSPVALFSLSKVVEQFSFFRYYSFSFKKMGSVPVKNRYALFSTVFFSQRGLKRFLSPKDSQFCPCAKCLISDLSRYIILLLENNVTILIVQGKNYLNHVNLFQPGVMIRLLNFQLGKAVYSIL